MQRHLDQEISEFKDQLLTMAGHAEAAVHHAVRALTERNDDLAGQVIEDDARLDHFEIVIDDLAIQLLTKAPLATDLRFITSAMKISQNLERVGDEATTIARRALRLNEQPCVSPTADISAMSRLATDMLKAALDAFVNRQAEAAVAVIPRDKEVDEINKRIQVELAARMVENPKDIPGCLHWMAVSKCLERIADHAKNIAEEVVYICQARDIRHQEK